MANDPQKLGPSSLCRLLNSTPLGEVITETQLRHHRTRAGLRIGTGKHIDLVRYVAWLVVSRHSRRPSPRAMPDLTEAALGAAALGSASNRGPKLTSKQESAIAMLLAEPTHVAAASKAGVSEATLYRWLRLPEFRAAYRRARRELVEAAVGRVQIAAGQAVETLVSIAHKGRRDGDRVRASIALLDHALRGVNETEPLHDEPTGKNGVMGELVQLVGRRLRQLDSADLPAAEKVRLTATLSDTLLRAIGIDSIDQRLEALQTVLNARTEGKKK
jgi:hypothetical protein